MFFGECTACDMAFGAYATRMNAIESAAEAIKALPDPNDGFEQRRIVAQYGLEDMTCNECAILEKKCNE